MFNASKNALVRKEVSYVTYDGKHGANCGIQGNCALTRGIMRTFGSEEDGGICNRQ